MVNEKVRKGDTIKKLRSFAITLFFAMAIIGAFFWGRKGGTTFILWGVAFTMLIVGVFWPKRLAPIYKAWMILALILSFISNHIILTMMYYFVFTPIGVLMRICGKDILQRKYHEAAKSYWIKREKGESDRRGYEKMF